MHFEGTFANAREGAHIVFMGTEANLYIDRGAYIITAGVAARRRRRPAELILSTRAEVRPRRRLLRRAGRRAAAPDQLGRVHQEPQDPDGASRGRRRQRIGGTPGEHGGFRYAGDGGAGRSDLDCGLMWCPIVSPRFRLC